MKRKLRNGIISGVSIAVAVSLLVASISSRQQVQAVDVFSETKSLIDKASGDFNIAELVDDLSSFPQVYNKDNQFVLDRKASAHIGNEELAYMVGGQEPYYNYLLDLASVSWNSDDTNTLTTVKNAMYQLMDVLKQKKLASENLSDFPISILLSDVVYRPEFFGQEEASFGNKKVILNNKDAFLQVDEFSTSGLTTAENENGENIYGYFIRVNSDNYGGVYVKKDDVIVYNGSSLAYEATVSYNVNSFNSRVNYADEWEDEEDGEDYYFEEEDDLDGEYYDDGYYDDGYYDDGYYDDGYLDNSFYPTQPNEEEDPSPFYYEFSVEPEVTDETVTIYTEGYNSALTQEEVKVLIPKYQSGLNQPIDGLNENGNAGNDDGNTGNDGSNDVLPKFSFYTVEEIERLQANPETAIDLANLSEAIPVTDANKEQVKQFRYISLSNNEWIKTQIFGIGVDADEGVDLSNLYAKFSLRVTSFTTVPMVPTDADTDDTAIFNLISNREFGTDSDWVIFFNELKLLYVHNVPQYDINAAVGTSIIRRARGEDENAKKMALLVNDRDTDPDAENNAESYAGDTYENLKSVLNLAYEQGVDRAVYEDEEGVAHFVRENIYFIDKPLLDVDTVLYSAINVKSKKDGFEEVQYRIEQENYRREQVQSALSNIKIDAVTRALAIQYILSYASDAITLTKSSLRVLELQPCNDFDYAPMNITYTGMANPPKANENTKAYQDRKIQEFKNDFNIDPSTDVEIVGMTTSEFCGRIEDLNVEYDMIYWGANIGTMNKFITTSPYGNCTKFNDYAMIGNIYTHVGDVNSMKGSEGTNYETNSLINSSARFQQNKYRFEQINGYNSYETEWLFRYSGNDILSYQVEKLLSYLKAKYPIVVSDKFFTNIKVDGEDITVISSSDVCLSNGNSSNIDNNIQWVSGKLLPRYGILDTSSYVYQFVQKAVEGKYPNFMTFSEARSSAENKKKIFEEYLNQPKLVLNIISQPVKYETSLVEKTANIVVREKNSTTKKVEDIPKEISTSVIDNANYLLPNSAGGYDLTYEFYISNATGIDTLNSRYTVSLYIDSNMDGRYTAREKIDLDYTNIYDLDSGGNVNNNELQSGVVYRIDRALPDGYIGALDWKLEVVANNNKDIRACARDISAVHKAKEDIYICQFVQKKPADIRVNGGWFTYKPEQGYKGDAYQVLGDNGMRDFDRQRSGLWTVLLDAVPDFNVHIITVDVDDYFKTDGSKDDTQLINKYSIKASDNLGYTFTFTPTLSNFDMLLFGYADGFMQTNDTDIYGNSERIEHVKRFISEGKSVLFTHDTSARNNKEANYKTLNIIFRDAMGLDRYGSTIGRSYGTYNTVTNGQEIEGEGKTIEEKQVNLKYKIFGDNGLNGHNRDIAFAPGTHQTKMTAETNAFTYTGWDIMLKYSNPLYAYDYSNSALNTHIYTSVSNYAWDLSHVMDTQVSQVNSGAITNYPYVLPEKMYIDYTHCQWYQLDLESDEDRDGEGDIVVWYTIDNSITGNNIMKKNYNDGDIEGPISATGNDLYDISPRDVRNNYYVYNKDNIIYTGMGQSPINNPDEVKLFINTMIAAYRVGTKDVELKFTQTDNNLNIKSSEAIPYDKEALAPNATYPVYFQVRDANLVANSFKDIYYKLYLEEPSKDSDTDADANTNTDPELTNLGITKKVTEITDDARFKVVEAGTTSTPSAEKNGYNKIKNEGVYQINVPLSLFETQDEITLYLRANSVVDKGVSKVTTGDKVTKIKISKLQLFNMD